MFNFTTLTVYNYISTTGANQNLWVATSGRHPQLRIGNTRFDKDNILDIQVKKPTIENLASVTFSMTPILIDSESTETERLCRIALYIQLSNNSQDSFYANSYLYKGKPFYIEFLVKSSDTAATVASRVVSNASKYFQFVSNEKLLDVTASGENVTIKGVNGYQQIKSAVLQRYEPEAIPVDCCAVQGDFIDVIKGVPVTYTTDAEGAVTTTTNKLDETGQAVALADDEVAIAPGLEAFGDYSWIIHNLRLPTAANTGFYSKSRYEMPTVGATYTQFIVRIIAERDGIAGGIVGQRATSVTTHVLYVVNDSASTVQSAFATLLGSDATTKIKTDADTVLQAPFS